MPKPLMFGYMRVDDDAPDKDVRQMELVLQDYAETRLGYQWATLYQDAMPGYFGAFHELTTVMAVAESHHLVVPTLHHLSTHPSIQTQLLRKLRSLGVAVWVLGPSPS